MPLVPAELELGKVLSKMLVGDVDMSATNGALQQRPEAFDALNMMDAFHILFRRMGHGAVSVPKPRQLGIGTSIRPC